MDQALAKLLAEMGHDVDLTNHEDEESKKKTMPIQLRST